MKDYLKDWEPCLADQRVDLAFFDGIRINADRITDPRWDRVLPILEEEQVFMCRVMAATLNSRPGARVLDIGTGSGVFAIYAARLGCRVIAIDISCRAMRFARHNASINKIPIVDHEPQPGDIQFIKCSYEDLKGGGQDNAYDVVILSPPYNPTCPIFFPALHAEAGELGQRCFEEQLPHASRLLKQYGVCIGNQMLVVDQSGRFEVMPLLQENFPGGEFQYLRILPEDNPPVEDFLRKQYATYLKESLTPLSLVNAVEAYIRKCSLNRKFALVYYELSRVRQAPVAGSDDAVIFTEKKAEDASRPNKTWRDRIELHRHIIEHTSLERSFPAPALFLEVDALPDFPQTVTDGKRSKGWHDSVLQYLETWLAKIELLEGDDSLFDLILVDTAPWYPSPEGRKGLDQEAAVWVAAKQRGHEVAKKILALYQDNTVRQQITRIGPFLHRHFTGQNQPEKWRGIQFTVHDDCTDSASGKQFPEGGVVCDLVRELDECQIDSSQKFSEIESPESLLGAAYIHSPLSELDVNAADLDGFDQRVRERIDRLREIEPRYKAASYEKLYPVDLEFCHQAMHRRLDGLIHQEGLRATGPSSLVGIPVSMALPKTNQSEKTLPENYRGGVWIYAIARGPWRPETEQYLLDLARLLSMRYEAEYSELAAKELRKIGFNSAQTDWSHETKNTIAALREWLHAPSDFNFTQQKEFDGEEYVEFSDFAIVPFRELFNVAMVQLQLWTMAGSLSDLPFYKRTSESLPKTLKELIQLSFEFQINTFFLRLFRKHLIRKNTVKALARVIEHFRTIQPHLKIEGTPNALTLTPDWEIEDKQTFWIDFTRLLLCAFREALQHGDWKEGITVRVIESFGKLEGIDFSDHCVENFELNIGDLPSYAPPDMTLNSVVAALTDPIVDPGHGGGRKGDGTQVRWDLAGNLRVESMKAGITKNIFSSCYRW